MFLPINFSSRTSHNRLSMRGRINTTASPISVGAKWRKRWRGA
jgi:hypothetical protein